MAVRTTVTAVREILNTGLTTQQISAFILDANIWITEVLVPAWPSALSVDRLEIIERYLTCALVQLRETGLTQVTIGDVTEQYQGDPIVTDYLMRAAAFDPTGTIRKNFLAPRPQAAPVPPRIPAITRWGKTFEDEVNK